MSTRIASIGVGKLSTTSRYVESFIVEIYSDSGYTVKIDAKVSGARWNGTVSVQTDYIQFDGLIFGTTYYLRAGVVTPASGVISAWTTFNTAAGTSSAPGCTYSGTFTATTSGIGYVVTPASVPSDIDHFEAVWQFDNTVPANTTFSHWSGQQTNGVLTFFVGGSPGQIAKVYVRGVNTSQQCQAWQLIDTRTVSTTWSGTTTGTIGDGTLLGTGGPSVNSASTGRLALAGAVGAAFLTGFGSTAAMSSAGNTGFNAIDTSGRSFTTYSGSNLYVTADNTGGGNRTFLDSSGAYSVGGGRASDNIITAVGSTAGGPGRIGVTGTDSFLRQASTTVARSYGMYNTGGNYAQLDETAGVNRTTINSSGQYGIGGAPSSQLHVFGNPFVAASGYDFRATNTQASGRTFGVGSQSAWDGVGYYQMALDHTASTQRLRMDSSGQVGFNRIPVNAFDVTGGSASYGAAAQLSSADRTSGLLHSFYADAGYARINNPTGGDVVTINRSTGNLGIGGTFTGDWISVQGASVLDSNKVVAGGVRGYRYTAGGSATWLKLGTWTFVSGNGKSVHVDIISAVGYNTGSAQQAHVELLARSGNNSAAPNISGGSYYGKGGSTPVTGFKIVAVGGSTSISNASWELWVNIAGFSDMIVSPTVDAGDTFTWAGTTGADPGAAGTTIVVCTGGMVMNTGGTGTDAIIDSTGNPLSGGKRGFGALTSSFNLVSGQRIGGDTGSQIFGTSNWAGFNGTPSQPIHGFSGDAMFQSGGTVKMRINNTSSVRQWSVGAF